MIYITSDQFLFLQLLQGARGGFLCLETLEGTDSKTIIRISCCKIAIRKSRLIIITLLANVITCPRLASVTKKEFIEYF